MRSAPKIECATCSHKTLWEISGEGGIGTKSTLYSYSWRYVSWHHGQVTLCFMASWPGQCLHAISWCWAVVSRTGSSYLTTLCQYFSLSYMSASLFHRNKKSIENKKDHCYIAVDWHTSNPAWIFCTYMYPYVCLHSRSGMQGHAMHFVYLLYIFWKVPLRKRCMDR